MKFFEGFATVSQKCSSRSTGLKLACVRLDLATFGKKEDYLLQVLSSGLRSLLQFLGLSRFWSVLSAFSTYPLCIILHSLPSGLQSRSNGKSSSLFRAVCRSQTFWSLWFLSFLNFFRALCSPAKQQQQQPVKCVWEQVDTTKGLMMAGDQRDSTSRPERILSAGDKADSRRGGQH